MEKCYQFLFSACNSSKFLAGDTEAANAETEDNTIGFIIANLGKLIKIISYLCKYSSEH
jgi:hypothetical protein